MDTEISYIRDFNRAQFRNHLRKMMENRLVFAGQVVYGLFMTFMILVIVGMFLVGIRDAGEIERDDMIIPTIAASLCSYYVLLFGTIAVRVTDRDQAHFFPMPINRSAIVRHRMRGTHKWLIGAIILIDVVIFGALSVNNDYSLIRSCLLVLVPVLSSILVVNLLIILFNLKKLVENPSHRRILRMAKYGYFALPVIAGGLLSLEPLWGIDVLPAATVIGWIFIWPPVITAYAIWGSTLHTIILFPMIVLLAGLMVKGSYHFQCALLSERYREPDWKPSFFQRLFKTNEKSFLPAFRFENGAGALETKNLIYILRPPGKPIMMIIMIVGMGLFFAYLMPWYMATLYNFMIIIMVGTKLTKHISFERGHLDKIRLMPARGPEIFWNYSMPGVKLTAGMAFGMALTIILMFRLRIGLALSLIVFAPIFVVTFYIISQEGFILKMRKAEIADVLRGKPQLGRSGMIALLYGIMMISTFGILHIDVAYFLLYLTIVYLWFLVSSVSRIGREMDEFLVPKMRKKYRMGILFKGISMVIALAFILIPWPYNYSDYPPPLEDVDPVPEEMVLDVRDVLEIRDEVRLETHHLLVHNGGILRIVNSTVTFSSTPEIFMGIRIQEGGILEVMNSTIRSGDDIGYLVRIFGTMIAVDSNFTGLWGKESNVNFDGGIEIYSDDVLLSNCRISDCTTNGIIIGDCCPVIENCVIENNGDDGIEVTGGEPHIVNTTIRNNLDGVYCMYGSNAKLLNCTIMGNSESGIIAEGCTATLTDCTISNNSGTGVKGRESNITLGDSMVHNNTKDIDMSDVHRFWEYTLW